MPDETTDICGNCGEGFTSLEAYLGHVCPKTEFTPADPENLGEDFAAVQQAALERGAAKTE